MDGGPKCKRVVIRLGEYELFGVLTWIASAVTYLLLAGQVSRNEMIACVGAGVAVAAFAMGAHRLVGEPFRLSIPSVRGAAAVLQAVVIDTGRVGAALCKANPGSLSCGPALPAQASDRGMAILRLSLAPNGFVAGVRRNAALVHRLVSTGIDP